MAEDTRFGSDYSTFRPDGRAGLTYRRITGPRVPLEGVARVWLTALGDMPWSPNTGTEPPVYQLQNAGYNVNDLRQLQIQLVRAARGVDWVADARVGLRYLGTTLTIAGELTLLTGRTYLLNVSASAAAGVVVQFPFA